MTEDHSLLQADNYFAIIPEWVLDADIDAVAVRVYGWLARRAGRAGEAKPGRKWMAQKIRKSTSTVDRAVRDLETIGAVCRRRERHPDGDFDYTVYTVHTSPCHGCPTGDSVPLPFETPSSPVTRGTRMDDGTGTRMGDEGVHAPVRAYREPREKESNTPGGEGGVITSDDDNPTPPPQPGSNGERSRRDGVWDALVERFYPSGVTAAPTRKRVGKVSRTLVAAGATAVEIHRRAEAWDKLWARTGSARPTLTLEALEKWWDELGATADTDPATRPPCPTCAGRGSVVVLDDGRRVATDHDDAWQSDITVRCTCVTGAVA